MSKFETLHLNRYVIDVYDLGIPNRTGTYFLNETKKAIIDTSASPSIPYLLDGLKELQVNPSEIDYVIVTHIHLDHAGGVGLLLQHCPNATVIVHPKGARHLVDPSRLIQGAKQVYGDSFNQLFDPILPIPENRVQVMNDGDTLKLSDDCTLTFLHTPGHANHHFTIHDSTTNGCYTGDTVGVSYEVVLHRPFFLPSTSPNQFDPEMMLQSAKRIRDIKPTYIYFGHFGMTHQVEEVWKQLEYWIPIFIETTKEVVSSTGDQNALLPKLIEALHKQVMEQLETPVSEEARNMINLDLQVCSMGLLDYVSKLK
ncbi:MBL fold metallo-hydrolase [Bacillus pinisoli]|uniref:MBL fold metallo-hydrolase n=1 Tax=Bacillus pinisoli TaxID=2901866 RepID=UPI001FF486C9|nr:MBL fold metallo-hydrolase [Bacillus pinisoli]